MPGSNHVKNLGVDQLVQREEAARNRKYSKVEMMLENRLKTRWAAGQSTINGWISLSGILSAEVMARAGWDSVTIDMQHGTADYADLLAILPVIQQTETVPLVRVPWNRPDYIMRALDAGALGIIAPMIETAEDTRLLVKACRYEPEGNRSFGPVRARLAFGDGYFAAANDLVLPIAMIETRSAFEQLDEILQVPGLGGIYIGPADLALAHGFPPGQDWQDPEMLQRIGSIVRQCQARGIAAAIHCSTPTYAQQMIDMGFLMVTAGTDAALLEAGARKVLAAFK